MFNKIIFQYAYSILANIFNYSVIPENVLIDGTIIDCESVFNAKNLVALDFHLNLSIRGPRADQFNKNDLKTWDDLAKLFDGSTDTFLTNSSMHGIPYILKAHKEMLENLFVTTLPDPQQILWEQVSKGLLLLTGESLSPEVIKFMQAFSEIPSESTFFDRRPVPFNWNEMLSDLVPYLDSQNLFELYFLTRSPGVLFLKLKLHIKKSFFKERLLTEFNSRNRMDMFHEAAINSQVMPFKDPIESASSLHHDINRATFSLPIAMNNNGETVIDKLKASEITTWIQTMLPQDEVEDLMVTYSSLNAYGKCYETTVPLLNFTPKETIIIIEVSSISKNFKFLTPPRLIQL